MKKLLFIVLMMVAVTISAEVNKLQGVWASDDIELEFTNDTLSIDEIGNEGDVYVYRYDSVNGLIHAESGFHFGDTFTIKVVKLTNSVLSVYYTDDEQKEIYTFKKKLNHLNPVN